MKEQEEKREGEARMEDRREKEEEDVTGGEKRAGSRKGGRGERG